MDLKFKITSTVKDGIINCSLEPSNITSASNFGLSNFTSKRQIQTESIKPSIDKFTQTYQHLVLSSNVYNGEFYRTNKKVYLYDFNKKQLQALMDAGINVSNESVDNKVLYFVNLPQSTVPPSLPYDKTSKDIFDRLDSFMKYLNDNKTGQDLDKVKSRILDDISLSRNRLLITSAYRDNLHQQWLRNTGGDRGTGGGKRNISKYPSRIEIQGVAQVGSSRHNFGNAVDIFYRKDNYAKDLSLLKTAVDIILILKSFGFKGFGFYKSGHIHVDTRKDYAFWFQLKETWELNIKVGEIYNDKEITNLKDFKAHVLSLLKRK